MIRNILYMMILCSFFSCGKERDQNFIRVSKVNPCYLEYSDGTPFIPVGPIFVGNVLRRMKQKFYSFMNSVFAIFRKMEEITRVFG